MHLDFTLGIISFYGMNFFHAIFSLFPSFLGGEGEPHYIALTRTHLGWPQAQM